MNTVSFRDFTHDRSDCETAGGARRETASLLLQQEEFRRNLPDILDGTDPLLPLDPKIYHAWAHWE